VDSLLAMLPPQAHRVLLVVTDGPLPAGNGLAARFPGAELTVVLPRSAKAASPAMLPLRADLEHLPLRTNAFDVVVISPVILAQQSAPAIREVARVLHPGGALALAVRDPAGTVSALIHLLIPNGFDVPLTAGRTPALDVIARRTRLVAAS
jgi:SAM-dependent methyltransferase